MNKYLANIDLFENELAYEYYLQSKNILNDKKQQTKNYYEIIDQKNKLIDNLSDKLNSNNISMRDFFSNKSILKNCWSFVNSDASRKKYLKEFVYLLYCQIKKQKEFIRKIKNDKNLLFNKQLRKSKGKKPTPNKSELLEFINDTCETSQASTLVDIEFDSFTCFKEYKYNLNQKTNSLINKLKSMDSVTLNKKSEFTDKTWNDGMTNNELLYYLHRYGSSAYICNMSDITYRQYKSGRNIIYNRNIEKLFE